VERDGDPAAGLVGNPVDAALILKDEQSGEFVDVVA
jgi:hypothetical protein